jgi:hydrogenase maturation protease
VAVVGVGNLVMGDEGIGVRVIQALEQEPLPQGVATFDAGTAFQALIGALAPFAKWIIVDAVKGGGRPGDIYRLGWEDAVEGVRGRPLSLHDLGVIEALLLEQLVDRASPHPGFVEPREVVFLGMEPGRIALSLELSPRVEQRLPELIRVVRDEVGWAPRMLPSQESVHNCNEEEPS